MEFEDCNPPSLIVGTLLLVVGISYWIVPTARFLAIIGGLMIVLPIIIAYIRWRRK